MHEDVLYPSTLSSCPYHFCTYLVLKNVEEDHTKSPNMPNKTDKNVFGCIVCALEKQDCQGGRLKTSRENELQCITFTYFELIRMNIIGLMYIYFM